MMRLDGRVALITGASRGIGLACAARLAQQGATVVLNGRDPATLAEAKAKLLGDGAKDVVTLPYDVASASAIKDGITTLHKELKRLDILINNAGVMIDGLLGMISLEQIQKTFETNVQSAILHTQYAARLMRREKAGAIVSIGSIMGVEGNAGQMVYSASKAALVGMTRAAAKELAPSNIRVNLVAPGFVETNLTANLSEKVREQTLARIGMGRFAAPEDVADSVLFLVCDMARYVTGQVLGVDGGMVI